MNRANAMVHISMCTLRFCFQRSACICERIRATFICIRATLKQAPVCAALAQDLHHGAVEDEKGWERTHCCWSSRGRHFLPNKFGPPDMTGRNFGQFVDGLDTGKDGQTLCPNQEVLAEIQTEDGQVSVESK